MTIQKNILSVIRLFLLLLVPSILWSQSDSANYSIVPHERTIKWKKQSDFTQQLFQSWASRKLDKDNISAKGNAPRILLAKLMLQKDIPLVNDIIKGLTVWGVSGTSWALNKNGDYDFTITPLTSILYLFGDQPTLLYPETQAYLLNTLLTEDGNNFRTKAPNSGGMVPETENHILMTEGSRYLKNRWLSQHGDANPKYNNETNGMEAKLLSFMEHMKNEGLYEFNSIPYIGYTITALLNLEAFGSPSIRLGARDVLDYMNWTFALGSYRLKHYPPMRRRYEKASITSLTTDYQNAFMKAWLSFSSIQSFDKNLQNGGEVHALMAACLPYRPADKVIDLLFNKQQGYFVKLGHGKNSCPEIFTAGKQYLLSAGGANRGEMSVIVARPICLFLSDTATDLSGIIHLAGPGTEFKKWNNTGVYKNFACAAGPVMVPSSFIPVATFNQWRVYQQNKDQYIFIFSTANLGIIWITEKGDLDSLVKKMMAENADESSLSNHISLPDGLKIAYELNAPSDKWVIKSVNEKSMNRSFENWALISTD